MPQRFCPFLYLIFFFSQAWAEEFVCAVSAPAAKIAFQTPANPKALVIFAQFKDGGAQDISPAWAADLFNTELPGSFAHFYHEMSRGRLRVEGQVLPRRYRSREEAGTAALFRVTRGILK